MPKADFEKNVQQKMQELRFRPSEEVWKRVEAGIATDKRRRPLVIWFLVAGLLLAGSTYYFTSRSSNENIAGKQPVQPGQTIAEKQTANAQAQNQRPVSQPKQVTASSEIADGTANDRSSSSSSGITKPTNRKRDVEILSGSRKVADSKGKLESENSTFNEPNQSGLVFTQDKYIRSAMPFAISPGAVVTDISLFPSVDHNLQNELPQFPEVVQSNKAPELKKTNWQFGISASGGFSDLGEELLQKSQRANLYFDLLQASPGTVVSRQPSELKSGASFSFNIYANKTLGKRWKLGTGIGYQYFSNIIKVGEKVDSLVLVNQNNFSMDRVGQYYKAVGNDPYHNQYHFISIPLYAQWRFAKKFTWENGIVASGMIKTNALHYDGVSGRYYEDEDLFNKFQLSATTAVFFNFYKNKIQVGPQFQYAFTNLLKDGTGNSKHLRSVSIKANVELWKN